MLAILALCPLLVAQTSGLGEGDFDPLAVLTASFPKSIAYKNHGKLLEFCPDNTCHGFSAHPEVSKATLRDFAFLYIYYFSDYYALPEWRAKEQVKDTADQVLSKPSYRSCRKESGRESARCILLNLSSHGRITLLFIRYDEGKRNVIQEDVRELVSEKAPSSQQ
jgi:hypothetical protein